MFTPIGLVTNPQVVNVSLNSQQVNVEEQRQERDRYDTPTLNQKSEELDENRPIEQMGAWGKMRYWELKWQKEEEKRASDAVIQWILSLA